MLSRPSNSRLAEVYQTEEFKNEWANDVRFHVARNLLYLRRYSGKSQDAVAQAMGTSQSAVARIESGQENITLDTLQRHVVALDGRFYVSIYPQAYPLRPPSPWWEMIAAPMNTRWHITPVAARRTEHSDQFIVGIERFRDLELIGTLGTGTIELFSGGVKTNE